jgi:hypothetical protein
MHDEIMGTPEAIRVDSLQFHVSLSRSKAEEFMRSAWVDAHSWWQVHPHVVDTDDFAEGDEVYYYSHRIGRLERTAFNENAPRRVCELAM